MSINLPANGSGPRILCKAALLAHFDSPVYLRCPSLTRLGRTLGLTIDGEAQHERPNCDDSQHLRRQDPTLELVDQAAAGEDVVVSRNGKPLARLTRLDKPKRKIRFGLLKGKVEVAPDFDAPLPDEVLSGFEGQ